MTNPELRAKLAAAIGNTGVRCDSWMIFDSYADLPWIVRDGVTMRLADDESYVVAWRAERFAWISVMPQLIERAASELLGSTIRDNLTAHLDAMAA